VAVIGWVVDKSAATRSTEPAVAATLDELGKLFLCEMGLLEELHSARSATDYDEQELTLRDAFTYVGSPPDILARALQLQRDLAHRHGMWHRTPIGDLVIAETALHHGLGLVHVDRDYERIAEVRPLAVRRAR